MSALQNPASRFCSFDAGPDRSWTDVFTNHTYISTVGPQYGPGIFEAIVSGATPDIALPQFLHEATHHCSFSTPVGTAMFLLEHRARQLIASAKSSDKRTAVAYKLRIDTVLTFYRPLLEGLALFAELDAIPSHSAVASNVASFALMLFARKEAAKSDNPFEILMKKLLARRRQRLFSERKVRVLNAPLESREGYLLGYLFVKGFATHAGSMAGKLTDTDLALGFMLSFFFCDYELVNQLLLPVPQDGSIAETSVELMTYLARRMHSLRYAKHLQSAAKVYERQALSGGAAGQKGEVAWAAAAPGNDSKRVKKARAALLDGVAEFPHDIQMQFARRTLLHICSAPIELTVSDGRYIATLEGYASLLGTTYKSPGVKFPFMSGPVEPEWAGPPECEGSINIFFDENTRAMGTAITVQNKVVALHLHGAGEQFTQQIKMYVLEREHIIAEADAAAAKLYEAVNLFAGPSDSITQSVEKYRTEVYRAMTFDHWLEHDRHEACFDALAKRGFGGVLDSKLVTSLSVLSALDTAALAIEWVSMGANIDLRADCNRIETIFKERFGGAPIRRIPDDDMTRVLSFV